MTAADPILASAGKDAASSRSAVLQTLVELLEIDGPLTGSELLASFEKWDSLTVISFVAYADADFDKIVGGDAILKAQTVDDLVALITG